jgi:hypothetical protein
MWEPSKGIDVSSAFRGITTPLNEILDEIHGRGWEAGKIDFKQGQFSAKGKSPHGDELEAYGTTEATAAGNLLLKIMRQETARQGPRAKLAQWQQDWSNNLEEVAKAYAAAPIYDPKAAPAWKELADDSARRAEVLKQQLQIEVVPDPEPYSSPQEMCQDVHQNKRFRVSSANSQHPVWSVEQNVNFRIVHDVLGHCVSGGDFGWEGENRACAAHFPLLTPLAQKALFTECIAQTAAGAYFRSFMPQKVVFLDEWIEKAQEQENPAAHQGIHPSQSLAPAAMPQVPQSTPQGLPWATQTPHQDFSGGLPVFGSITNPRDPNSGWSSNVEPMPDNAYLWRDDPLGAHDVKDNAMKVDTGWANLKHPDGTPDYDSMKQAITNAFRVVLLSPRKDLRWNAIHYQDIMNVPATVTDPKRYWDTLESKRESWNQARGYAPGSHKSYWKELADFKRYVRAANPNMDEWEADDQAEREFMHMWSEEEDRLTAEPKNENKTADEISRMVEREITKRLKSIVKPENAETDYGHEQMHMAGSEPGLPGDILTLAFSVYEQMNTGQRGNPGEALRKLVREQLGEIITPQQAEQYLDQAMDMWFKGEGEGGALEGPFWEDHLQQDIQEQDPDRLETMNQVQQLAPRRQGATQYDLEGNEAGKYGAFMGGHLKAISQISQHVDELLAAALKDANEDGGTGHHFRAKTLSLGIPGVGPKVASFAWLLLQPGTSQLATIDSHMMDVLDHDYSKEMNNRDYFKFERELAAGRDASGYNHVPLGQFQWGMWDHKRTGPGTHQDHSAMKVLDPVPHDQVDWAQKMPVQQNWQAPDWWEATKPAREMVAQDWDRGVATQFPRTDVPHHAKTARTDRVPWILWGEKVWVGSPGETFMNLARRELNYSMEDVWQRLPESMFSTGVYDPSNRQVFAPGDTIDDSQQELIRQYVEGAQHQL